MIRLRIVGAAVLVTIVAGVIAMGFGQRSGEGVLAAGEKKTTEVTKETKTDKPEVDALRRKYLQRHLELSWLLTDAEVRQRLEELDKEMVEAKERRLLRESKAVDELDKVRMRLRDIATTYEGTEAGKKARQALETAGPPTERKTETKTEKKIER
jgi:hypothetical protein